MIYTTNTTPKRRKVPCNGLKITDFDSLLLFRLFIGKTGFFELCFHRGIASCQLLDGEGFGLVVRKAEVVLAADQGFFDFIQVLYGLVDLIDSRFESFAGKTIVFAESLPKIFELTLEIRNVDGLFLCDGKLFDVY